jgi:predicted PurR-regulated permease PerM
VPRIDRRKLENGTFLVLFAFAAYLFWQTLEPVWIPVFLGLTIAVTAYPLQEKLLRRRRLARHPGLAAALITALVMTVMVGLITFLVFVVGSRVLDLLRSAADRYQHGGAPGLLGDDVTAFLGRFGIETASLQRRLGELLRDLAAALGKSATTVITATFSLIFVFVFTALTSYYLLVEGREGTAWLVEVIPLPDGEVWELVRNVRDVTRAMLFGTGVTALYQGAVAFVGYWIFGVASPLVWAALTGVASFLPAIGTALVWVPVALVVLLSHHPAEGIGLLLWGALVIVFVADYILRPKLVGTRMRMNDLLVFIAIFGGVEAFGILGVVMGPIAVALFLSMVRIYMRDYRPEGPPAVPDVTEAPRDEVLQNAP